ncbi:MAG: hypothetical protein K2G03_06490 [Bacilli bacterium]|nr:hypothetical protein [Bacilli bacterium]
MSAKKPKEKLSSKELLDLLSCQWMGNEEIMKIANCGLNKAGEHRKNIESIVKERTNKVCPYKKVPTEYVVEYFGINIGYLKKTAMGGGK